MALSAFTRSRPHTTNVNLATRKNFVLKARRFLLLCPSVPFGGRYFSSTPKEPKNPPLTLFGMTIPQGLLKGAIETDDGYNRWMFPPMVSTTKNNHTTTAARPTANHTTTSQKQAISLHMCFGSVYAWSIFNAPLSKELGGVVSASADWDLSSLVPCFGTAICCLGFSAALVLVGLCPPLSSPT